MQLKSTEMIVPESPKNLGDNSNKSKKKKKNDCYNVESTPTKIKSFKTYDKTVDKLDKNQIFVFSSNTEGKHKAGSALVAFERFGAIQKQSRGMQGQSYGLVTKNLKDGYIEPFTGITYKESGFNSLTPNQIVENILELYQYAAKNPSKEFIIGISSKYKTYNGYYPSEMAQMFGYIEPPENVVFDKTFLSLVIQNGEFRAMPKAYSRKIGAEAKKEKPSRQKR